MTVDSLIGVAVAVAAALASSLGPVWTPAQFNNTATAHALFIEARGAAHATGIAVVQIAPTATGVSASLLEAGHSGSSDPVTGTPVGLVLSSELDQTLSASVDGAALKPPFTVRFGHDGKALINGNPCTKLTFAFASQGVTDSFTLACQG